MLKGAGPRGARLREWDVWLEVQKRDRILAIMLQDERTLAQKKYFKA